MEARVAHVYDVAYWRKQAEESRAAAEVMTSAAAKRELLAIAEAYDRLADEAERKAGRKAARSRDSI
jgi:hypothetical protein